MTELERDALYDQQCELQIKLARSLATVSADGNWCAVMVAFDIDVIELRVKALRRLVDLQVEPATFAGVCAESDNWVEREHAILSGGA